MQQPGNGEENNQQWKNEAYGVDGDAPLRSREPPIFARTQRREYDAGNKGLQDFKKTRDGGEKAADFTRVFVDQPDLAGVQSETQPGHRGRPDLPGAGGAGEERGKDDWNGDRHKCGQHGKGHGEVLPGYGHFGVQVGELQDEDEEGRETAEAPAEHAPGPMGHTMVWDSRWRRQCKADASQNNLQHSHNADRLNQCPELHVQHDQTVSQIPKSWCYAF